MNNKKFEEWTNDNDYKASTNTHLLIDKQIRKTSKVTKVIKWSLASAMSLFLVFAILVNTSTQFYVFALKTPLKDIAELLSIMKKGPETDYNEFLEKNKYQKIDQTFSWKYIDFDYEKKEIVNIKMEAEIIGIIYDVYSATIVAKFNPIPDSYQGGMVIASGGGELVKEYLPVPLTVKVEGMETLVARESSVGDDSSYYFIDYIFEEPIQAGKTLEIYSSPYVSLIGTEKMDLLMSTTIEDEYLVKPQIIDVNKEIGIEDRKILITNIIVGKLYIEMEYESLSAEYKLMGAEVLNSDMHETIYRISSSGGLYCPLENRCLIKKEYLPGNKTSVLEFQSLVWTKKRPETIEIVYNFETNKWENLPSDWNMYRHEITNDSIHMDIRVSEPFSEGSLALMSTDSPDLWNRTNARFGAYLGEVSNSILTIDISRIREIDEKRATFSLTATNRKVDEVDFRIDIKY